MNQTINRQPTQTYLDATDLLWLMDQWLAAQATAIEPITLVGYRVKTDYFRHWWQVEGPKRHWQLTKKDLVHFELHLRTLTAKQTGEALSWHTRNDALRRLKEMFLWAYHNEYTTYDYGQWLPAAHGAPIPRQAATVSQLHQLFTACTEPVPEGTLPHPKSGTHCVRNAAIMAILIGTGIRCAECANLHIEDLLFHADNSGLMNIVGKRTKANPSGRRQVAFDAIAGIYLLTYLKERRQDKGSLFIAEDGHQLTSPGIYKIVKRLIRIAKLEKVIQGPHDLRRAFATHFARQHPDAIHADMLRRQLGHAHYTQTSAYTLLDASDLVGHITSPLANK